VKIRVYYEDTDAGGIVYHSKYLNFCERARSEEFFKRGMMPAEGDESGFVVRKITADFLSSAKLGDLLEIKSRPKEIKHTSLALTQEIFKDSTALFRMEVQLVYVVNGKIKRIPKDIFDILERIGKP